MSQHACNIAGIEATPPGQPSIDGDEKILGVAKIVDMYLHPPMSPSPHKNQG